MWMRLGRKTSTIAYTQYSLFLYRDILAAFPSIQFISSIIEPIQFFESVSLFLGHNSPDYVVRAD